MKLIKLILGLTAVLFLTFGSYANTSINSSLYGMVTVNPSKSDQIVSAYLQLKNALVNDDSKAAAIAAKEIIKAFKSFDISEYSSDEEAELADIIENASEQAEHISENVGNIEHQREHFEIISNDIIDLLAITGSSITLYQTRCPMFNNGKGGIWLSETKEIKNPFYGSKMLTCGSVQKEL